MNSRERVLTALNHQQPDRMPRDLGGMLSTGISAFAYPKLRKALGLVEGNVKVHDVGQMLALPDMDVLDALDCDVVTIQGDISNALYQPEKWHDYTFNGRLKAQVRNPDDFKIQENGDILFNNHHRMLKTAYVFDEPSGGQLLNLSDDLPLPNLEHLGDWLSHRMMSDEEVDRIASFCAEVRSRTDRAIMYCGSVGTGIGIGNYGGIGIFPILCLEEPEHIAKLHSMIIDHRISMMKKLLPAIADNVDILMVTSDDWGTQQAPIASPKIFRELFLPYLKKYNKTIHSIAPQMKSFMHSCGAIYDLLDMIIESGIDVINPVQWTAGGHSYLEWKEKCKGRLALWGGGVDTQGVLARGTSAEVEAQAKQISSALNQDGGYVFCAIHNLLAEVPPEKILALYRGAL